MRAPSIHTFGRGHERHWTKQGDVTLALVICGLAYTKIRNQSMFLSFTYTKPEEALCDVKVIHHARGEQGHRSLIHV